MGALMKKLSKKLDNKVAIVTGAANGIGRAVALRMAGEGARVVAVDIVDAAGIERAAEDLGTVLSVAETFENQHLRERGTVRTIDDPIHGPVDIPGMPIKWSRLPNNIPLDAPTLGQHNEVILTEMLGRSAEEIDALSHDGVLFSRNS